MSDITLLQGDCVEILKTLPSNSIDAIVCDPPYGIRFMSKEWDDAGDGPAQQEWHRQWAVEAIRALKPGGYLVAFGGTRTYHRLASAVEDAGFEIRDSLIWMYGKGFPKSLNVGKAIDKAAGAVRPVVGTRVLTGNAAQSTKEKGGTYASNTNSRGIAPKVVEVTAPATDAAKQWDGWGTALKPTHEPIVLARKPLDGTVAENVQKWGVGALNVDGCRIPTMTEEQEKSQLLTSGRWPANVILDDDIAATFGEPARFFYCAKVSKSERGENNIHPTVKPVALMEYLVKMVCPPNGIVLDPFMGSGSTGIAVKKLGFSFLGIEKEPEYFKIAESRISNS